VRPEEVAPDPPEAVDPNANSHRSLPFHSSSESNYPATGRMMGHG
jgi:hypothetical protein